MDCLNRRDVEGAERAEQEDKAQDKSNDLERLAFDEHAHNAKSDARTSPAIRSKMRAVIMVMGCGCASVCLAWVG